jgi:hypothetical protein
MGRIGFRARTRRYAFLLVRARSWRGCRRRDTTPVTGMRHFWRIPSAIAPSRSRSIRVCAKNARSVTSGQLQLPGDRDHRPSEERRPARSCDRSATWRFGRARRLRRRSPSPSRSTRNGMWLATSPAGPLLTSRPKSYRSMCASKNLGPRLGEARGQIDHCSVFFCGQLRCSTMIVASSADPVANRMTPEPRLTQAR